MDITKLSSLALERFPYAVRNDVGFTSCVLDKAEEEEEEEEEECVSEVFRFDKRFSTVLKVLKKKFL